MKDRFYNGKHMPVESISSFDVEMPDNITDEIDKTLLEIDRYILGTRPEDQISSEKEILSDRKRKIISKISKWKYSFR